MTALREVFARFTTQFDGRSLQRGAHQTSMLSERLRSLGGVIVGALGVHALRSFVRESAALGDELDKTSKVLGISIQDLQSWRHAANLSGVSGEAFSSGVTRLQRQMLDASRGVATAKDAFDRLGIRVKDSGGNLRPVNDILRDMADPLANLESSSERTGLLMMLMGRSGARMGPLFADGAAGVDRMRAELEALGGGASSEFVQQSADLTDEMARLDMVFLSLRSRIAVAMLPALRTLTEGMAALARNTEIVRMVGLSLATALSVQLVKAFARMGVAGLAANAMAFGMWFGIGAVILGVALLLNEVWATFEGKDTLITRLVDATEDWILRTRDQAGWLGTVASVLDRIAIVAEEAAIAMERLFGGGVDESTAAAVLNATDGAIDLNTAEGRRAARQLQGGASATDVLAGLQRDTQAGSFARQFITGGAEEEQRRRTIARVNRGAGASQQQVNQQIEIQAQIDARGMDEQSARRLINRRIGEELSGALEANAPGVGSE